MADSKPKWKKNRLLRAITLPLLSRIVKTYAGICTAISWLSPGQLLRYWRLTLAKHKGTTFVAKIPMTGCLMELDPSNCITRSWYVRADFERSTVLGLKYFLRPNMVCMDIGANAGLFTLLMASQVGNAGKVYAFEPTSTTFQQLRKNIEINSLQNVVVENMAVTEQTGMVEFHIGPPELCVYNSIADVVHPSARNGVFSRVEIPSTSIDDYCKNNNISNVDCVKIDVEGAEWQVLKGMRNILEKNPQIILLIEFSQITATPFGTSVDDMAAWLRNMNFQLFLITADKFLQPVNDAIPSNGEMVWAVRPELHGFTNVINSAVAIDLKERLKKC